MSTDTIRRRITDLVVAIRDAQAEDVEDSINAVSDDLSTGERSDDLVTESILDGIRWGHRAALVVELGGGTILRIREPGGVGITHEWLDKPQSAVGRASIMQTVQTAMGDHEAGQEVTAVWNEAVAQTVEQCARILEADAEIYHAEVNDQRKLGRPAMSRTAQLIENALLSARSRILALRQ